MLAWDQFTLQSPEYLWAICAVPLLWWLLRLIPPEAIRRRFPSLNLFQNLPPLRAQTAHTPLWLLILRGVMVLILVVFFAEPIWKSGEIRLPPPDQPVILLVDNCWTAAPNWPAMHDKARSLLSDLPAEQNVAIIAACPEAAEHTITAGLVSAPQARLALRQLRQNNQTADWGKLIAAVQNLELAPIAQLNIVSSGVIESDAFDIFQRELQVYDSVTLALPPSDRLPLKLDARRVTGGVEITVQRLWVGTDQRHNILLRNARKNVIAMHLFDFRAGERQQTILLEISPSEMDEISAISMDGMGAAAQHTFYAITTPARIGLAANEESSDLMQPQHSLVAALTGETDIVTDDWDVLLSQNLPVIIAAHADLPDTHINQIHDWIARGGRLIRFAAQDVAPPKDALMPAQILRGIRIDRSHIFAAKPLALSPYPANSPLALAPLKGGFSSYWLVAPQSLGNAEIWANYDNGAAMTVARNIGKGKTILVTAPPVTGAGNWIVQGGFPEFMRALISTIPETKTEQRHVSFSSLALLDAGNLPGTIAITDLADRQANLALAPYMLALLIMLFVIDQALIIIRFAGMIGARK